MKALYVRKLYLWPRFQADIQGNLPNIDVRTLPCQILSLQLIMSLSCNFF